MLTLRGVTLLPSSLKVGVLALAAVVVQVCLAQPAPTLLKLQDQAILSEQALWIYLPIGDEPTLIQGPGGERWRVSSLAEGTAFGFKSVRNGFIWDIRRITTAVEGKPERRAYLYRHPVMPPENTWERVAELDTSAGVPHYLVPLDRPGWFIGVGPFTGFFKEARASHVALFRQQNEMLIFEDLVDMPLGNRSHISELKIEPWPAPVGGKVLDSEGKPRVFKRTIARAFSLSPDLWLPALLPGHLVLAASKAGVLWFFSLKNGQCQRTVDLGGVPTDELNKLGHLDHFLLSAQPDKDHRLLVVTRQPETLFFARALFTADGAPRAVWEGNHKRFLEIMDEHTGLQWWAINPETGSKERIEDPSSYPERAISFAQAGKLRFLVGPDGRVHANTESSWQDMYEQMGLKAPVPSARSGLTKEQVDPKEKRLELKGNPSIAPQLSSTKAKH